MHRDAEMKAQQSAETTRTTEHDAAAGAQGPASAPASGNDADLDFEALDLSIETVEERISPSETNVFDK